MTDQQILLVKKSWMAIQRLDPVLIGNVFYTRLYSTNPELKSLFQVPVDIQSRKLMEMLNMIVERLDRFNELIQDIKSLAIRHVGYGVKPVDYEAVGSALLWTIQHQLAKVWSDELDKAWAECYSMLSSTMIEAAGSDSPTQ
jgi:nitric oxide dioxygenase